MSKSRNYIWKEKLVVATSTEWTEALPFSTGWRPFIKIHNTSDQVLLVAFNKETMDTIYHPVVPNGFWEFTDGETVPRNAVYIKAEDGELDISVIVTEAEV